MGAVTKPFESGGRWVALKPGDLVPAGGMWAAVVPPHPIRAIHFSETEWVVRNKEYTVWLWVSSDDELKESTPVNHNDVLADVTFNLSEWVEVLPGEMAPAGRRALTAHDGVLHSILASSEEFEIPQNSVYRHFVPRRELPTAHGSKIYYVKHAEIFGRFDMGYLSGGRWILLSPNGWITTADPKTILAWDTKPRDRK